MIRKADLLSADLKRIPGLYRRWELPEILKNQRAYRIENAGAHQDGTPLVAIYADRFPRSSSAPGWRKPFPATGWNTIAAFWCSTSSLCFQGCRMRRGPN